VDQDLPEQLDGKTTAFLTGGRNGVLGSRLDNRQLTENALWGCWGHGVLGSRLDNRQLTENALRQVITTCGFFPMKGPRRLALQGVSYMIRYFRD